MLLKYADVPAGTESDARCTCVQVLRDPRQKRFFKAKDMSDLFQLSDPRTAGPETAQIFAGINSEIPLIEAGQATALTTPSLAPADVGIAATAGEEVKKEVADGTAAASTVQKSEGPKDEGEGSQKVLRFGLAASVLAMQNTGWPAAAS